MYFEIYERERSLVAALRGHLMGGGDWRWQLRDSNNQVIASARGFPTRSAAERAVEKLRQDIEAAPIRVV